MTHLASEHVETSSFPATTNDANAAGWNTLLELRDIATSTAFTKTQFDEAVESVGKNPFRVANYLQHYIFSRAIHG